MIRSAEQRAAVAKVSHDQKWMNTAPVFIACVGDIRCRIRGYDGPALDEHSELPEIKKMAVDMGIGIEHLVLEAEIRATFDAPEWRIREIRPAGLHSAVESMPIVDANLALVERSSD